jgi:hypothetical protein
MSMMWTSTEADEQEDDSINQILLKGSGYFKDGYAGINVAPDAGTAVVDATGDCEMVANSAFGTGITPNDGVTEDLGPKAGLRRPSAEQPVNVQTDEFEPTSRSAELDHEGALRSFEAGPPHSSLWPRSLLDIPYEIPKVAIPITATDSRLPETRTLALRFYAGHPKPILATSTLRPASPASTSTFDPTTYSAFLIAEILKLVSSNGSLNHIPY